MTRTLRAWVSPALMGLILGVVMVVIPDSSLKPTDMVLVETRRASSVDVNPDVVWILAVGSDARPGEDLTRARGDALQLVGINSVTGAATAIGIPRDSYVAIPGVGMNRVNAALYYGGPELLAETIGDMVGIDADYVFVTSFKRFQALVDGIGGITVNNPRFFSDPYLKPKGFEEGKIGLRGYTAMAFARVRKGLAAGDFDRSANQQRVMQGIQERLREKSSTPGFLEAGVISAMENLATTSSPSKMFHLAHVVATLRSSKFTMCVVQGSLANVGGASVVLPYLDQARRYGDEARDDATIENC
ncbi:LCP family protein [Nocardioides sp.]|uniref:LCP family protein n=1 Tax=Nocardioides sp. TaxID=35761 RepID=UPI00356A66DD